MKKYEWTAEEQAFGARLRAAVAADDGTDYGWMDDLPEDPGVPVAGDDVVVEMRRANLAQPKPGRRLLMSVQPALAVRPPRRGPHAARGNDGTAPMLRDDDA